MESKLFTLKSGMAGGFGVGRVKSSRHRLHLRPPGRISPGQIREAISRPCCRNPADPVLPVQAEGFFYRPFPQGFREQGLGDVGHESVPADA